MNYNITKYYHLLFFFKETVKLCNNVRKTAATANQIWKGNVPYVTKYRVTLFWGFVAKLNVKIIQTHRYSIDDLLIQWFLVIHKRHVHSYHHFESQKAYKQHKINTYVSWEYIEVLMPQG